VTGSNRIGLVCLLAIAALTAGPRGAAAQSHSAHALFVEAVRDPGDPDVSPTARALALGGTRIGSGVAEDAATSPATLMLGAGTDVVISGGARVYARDELADTPDRFPPRLPDRARAPGSSAIPMYFGVATRWRTWAVGAFYDASAAFEHQYDTATSNIYYAALQGTFVSEDGTGHAAVSERLSRFGGAFTAGTPDRRFAAGVAVTGTRVDVDATAHVHAGRRVRVRTRPDHALHGGVRIAPARARLGAWRDRERDGAAVAATGALAPLGTQSGHGGHADDERGAVRRFGEHRHTGALPRAVHVRGRSRRRARRHGGDR